MLNILNRGTYILALLCVIIYSSCMPYREEKLTEVSPDIRDSVCQQIFEWQDEHKIEKLYPFFQHKNPTYRYLSAVAIGSMKDSAAIDSLAVLLKDEIDEVRAAAAFSLGQTGATYAVPFLIDAFAKGDTIGQYKKANRAILEAIGRCGDETLLHFLSTTTTYQSRDTFLLEGQSWGIYRFALRRMVIPEGTKRMLDFIENPALPASVRLIAANYLFRAQNTDLDSLQTSKIADVFKAEKDVNIRMALAVALGKGGTSDAFNALKAALKPEEDYRVKCNIIRALGNFSYESTTPIVQPLLKDANIHVANRAAQYFLENGLPQDASAYWNWSKEIPHWETKLTLYRAANKLLPVYFVDYRNNINAELREMYVRSNNPYEKAACLHALAEFGWNYRYVFREAQNHESAVVRTAGVESLSQICESDNFRSTFTSSANYVTREIAGLFKVAIESGDPGQIGTAAAALQNPERNFKAALRDSIRFLVKAKDALELPRELEIYNELNKTIAYFNEEEESPARKPEFSHPIDWSEMTGLGNRPKVEIKTSKGNIEIELYADIAPGSVINFINLSRSGFYDNLAFHRVVPNFVIQGGCPRGDGWGGLNYTIRSELTPLHYNDEGFLGMASSGNHTECTQFFITHSPTPHLDGNYTIFGKVIKGMDVVHDMQQGDVINSINIL